MKPKIILAGGTGFLGRLLAAWFSAKGTEVVVLTRQPRQDRTLAGSTREVPWDGATLGPWAEELEGAQAVLNLAGTSVNCRYTSRNRCLILDSRLAPTRVLGQAIARCATPPLVWCNASTATIYRHTFGPAWDETGDIAASRQAKDEFSVHVAEQWERAFYETSTPVRKAALRTAMVLGHAHNSVLPNMLWLARLGLGGCMAGGHQYMSWIHQEDFCRAVEWLLEHADVDGAVNVCSPNPVTNAEFMATVRRACRRRFGIPAPRALLELGAFFMRTETELVIKSRRVVPGKLLSGGFRFVYPLLTPAIESLIREQSHGA